MCKWCLGGGWVLAQHRVTLAVFAFRCECRAGKVLSNLIPVWVGSGGQREYDPSFSRPAAPSQPAEKSEDFEDEGIF